MGHAHTTVQQILETGIDVVPSRYDNLPALMHEAREAFRGAREQGIDADKRRALVRFYARCSQLLAEIEAEPPTSARPRALSGCIAAV